MREIIIKIYLNMKKKNVKLDERSGMLDINLIKYFTILFNF